MDPLFPLLPPLLKKSKKKIVQHNTKKIGCLVSIKKITYMYKALKRGRLSMQTQK